MANLCVICEEDEATARCVTCRKCRAYIHRWGNEKDGRIIDHFDKLRVRVRRMTTFAIVKDETIKHVDFHELQEQRIIYLSKKEQHKRVRRQAKAHVISIRVAERQKSQSVFAEQRSHA